MFAELTTEGIIFVSVAWIGVLSLTVFCFAKVMSGDEDLSSDENN